MTKTQALAEAKTAIGGFTQTSKMPGLSYGLPANECVIGRILAQHSGTVCNGCYALRGRYLFEPVQKALKRRSTIIRQNPELWADNVIRLLPHATDCKDFRWHDSGDIQGMAHLLAIVRIARELPDYHFWLPSKEYALIREYLSRFGVFPSNLRVRLSAPMLGDTTYRSVTGFVSYVSTENVTCPAPQQNNECKDCRLCWSDAPIIVYKRH